MASRDTEQRPDEEVTRAGGESLQEQVEEAAEAEPKRYGTVSGVFVPTLLTILGVILYLREGWVVGNAGLLGAWAIILLSFAITGFTGLSLSSITTNIRIGPGGAFSVISQSLGLEVGGSVGIPLYFSQALAVAMYIFGFRAGWTWIFPDHPALYVDFATFAALFAIAFASTSLAFRVQYLILAVIVGSLLSVAWAAWQGSMQQPVTWWGDFRGSPETGFSGIGFWAVFAVFFPASTGIMAGANMSGDLKNPRASIPVGTLSAIGLSLVVYLAIAYWLARTGTPEELTGNYTFLVERSAYGPVVLAGLLGATFSSALSSLVGAPRILQALGQHNIVPGGAWFAARTAKGEPRNGMLVTGVLVAGALLLRDLNAVAPLITMFFLITYAMINGVVFLEQSLRLVSFRPLFRVPRFVSLLGAAGCLFAMFVVNPVVSLVAVVVVLALHGWLIRRHLAAPFGDVRSGLFVALAEWAARKVTDLAASTERTWKANVLVPVEDPRELRGAFEFIRDLAYPKGFLKILGLTGKTTERELAERLPDLAEAFRSEGVISSWTVIDAASFGDNLAAGMEALGGAFFKPNVLFLRLPEDPEREQEVGDILKTASRHRVGVLLYADEPVTGLGRRHAINVWLEDRGPDWELSMDLGNQDLALLAAYKLKRNWEARLLLIAPVREPEEEQAAEAFAYHLADLARLPARIAVVSGDVVAAAGEAPQAALNVFPLAVEPDFDRIRALRERTRSACLFALDSGDESALA